MPLELGIWRIDQQLSAIQHEQMDNEKRLEDLLERDISIIASHLMIIGRQIITSFGKFVDLLAIDAAGNLAVVELKRDQTPREVVAQVLDYGSWVHGLDSGNIAEIWQDYRKKYHPNDNDIALDQAFCQRFKTKAMPEDLNAEHELIVVASALDDSTERIVDYLAGYHGVNINAVLFRLFKDGDREYLTRAWLRDPTSSATEPTKETAGVVWNGEYYVSFGGDERRDWDECVKYGFVSGGGGLWYSNTLLMLEPGARIWVNMPGVGYLGVGTVTGKRVPAEQYLVKDSSGNEVPITTLPVQVAKTPSFKDSPEIAEFVVPVQWIKTVKVADAIKERGFFGNQNTVARPVAQKWVHTIERLKQRFDVA